MKGLSGRVVALPVCEMCAVTSPPTPYASRAVTARTGGGTISRVPAIRSWLSDAVFGAPVGIVAGRTVTGHELNQFPVTVAYAPGGAAVMYVRR